MATKADTSKFFWSLIVMYGARYSGSPLYGHPLNTVTRILRTVSFVPTTKSHIFSLKVTRLILTPVNTDNGHFSSSRVTNSHTSSTPPCGHWLSAHCLFCALNIGIVPFSNNDRLLRVKMILLQKKTVTK